MSLITATVAILVLVATTTVLMLLWDVKAARLRGRVQGIRASADEHNDPTPIRPLAIHSVGSRSRMTARLMNLLRFNPEIAAQNVIAWQLVFVVGAAVAIVGFFYCSAIVGWPLAILAIPIEAFLVSRVIFSWERARFQRALLEQIPEVMAMICRAIAAGIPFSEALRSVAREAPVPSRAEFLRVVNEVSIGQAVEPALWRMHERVALPEYAFFAVTIGLQAQTGGSLVETLQNLQDLVRARVALSKRGKALAAEARMSARILVALPFVMSALLYFIRPGFFDFFFVNPTGQRQLLVFVALMSTGIFMMRQLIRRSLAP
jgi:tight adherence protein B